MAVRRIVDLSTLKARFRTAALARGIDPLAGATGYQVVHLLTERQRGVRSSSWWNDPDLWDREDDPIRHSQIEEMALTHLFLTSYLKYIAAVGNAAQAARADIPPLREHLAARGEQLIFVETGDGSTVSLVALVADEAAMIG